MTTSNRSLRICSKGHEYYKSSDCPEDIALTIHAHPTLGELTMEAAEVIIGRPIHVVKA